MVYLLARWFIATFALLIAAVLIPGVEVSSLYIALITAAILGVLNTLVRPVLILLTIPITLVTLGIFIIILNGLLFWFVSSFVQGFTVSGFLPALAGALVVSAGSYIGNEFLVYQRRSHMHGDWRRLR